MEKINFKKVAIIYFVLLLITIIGIMFLLGNKYYDKLTFLYHYHNICEILEEKDSNNIFTLLCFLYCLSTNPIKIALPSVKSYVFDPLCELLVEREGIPC